VAESKAITIWTALGVIVTAIGVMIAWAQYHKPDSPPMVRPALDIISAVVSQRSNPSNVDVAIESEELHHHKEHRISGSYEHRNTDTNGGCPERKRGQELSILGTSVVAKTRPPSISTSPADCGPQKRTSGIEALSYQLDNMLVHQFSSRFT
jgi:hypothetical protein